MDNNESYSTVYVMVTINGFPTMVVQTEREAIELQKKDPVEFCDYYMIPYKHHN